MNRSSRVSSTTPRSKRDNQDAPPTARSARDLAGIPPDAPKIKFEGQTWVQLWDPEESAYYWYCPKNKKAQWEKPGEVYESSSGYDSSGALTDYSTDWYDSGGDNTDSEYGGDNWQEFYDDSAQAKYWYNSVTVSKYIYYGQLHFTIYIHQIIIDKNFRVKLPGLNRNNPKVEVAVD